VAGDAEKPRRHLRAALEAPGPEPDREEDVTDHVLPEGQAWHLVYRPFRQDDAALAAFRDRLMANAERDPG
jgi:hypothetical protein